MNSALISAVSPPWTDTWEVWVGGCGRVTKETCQLQKSGWPLVLEKLVFYSYYDTVANYDQVTGYPYGIPTTIVVVFVFPCLLLFRWKEMVSIHAPQTIFFCHPSKMNREPDSERSVSNVFRWNLRINFLHMTRRFNHVYSVFWLAIKSGSILHCVTGDLNKFSLTYRKISTRTKCFTIRSIVDINQWRS